MINFHQDNKIYISPELWKLVFSEDRTSKFASKFASNFHQRFEWWISLGSILRIHKQLKFEGFRRISKDFEGFYSISTASFVVWIDFSAHSYLETLQDRRLGFPKRPYFWKSNQMATRDEPLKDVDWKLVNTQKMGHRRWEGHRLHLSQVRHESPSHWIFKSKDVLKSHDADLEMSQGS